MVNIAETYMNKWYIYVVSHILADPWPQLWKLAARSRVPIIERASSRINVIQIISKWLETFSVIWLRGGHDTFQISSLIPEAEKSNSLRALYRQGGTDN